MLRVVQVSLLGSVVVYCSEVCLSVSFHIYALVAFLLPGRPQSHDLDDQNSTSR